MAFRLSSRRRRTLIGIDNISKRFGSYAALNDISLDVRSGEFLALLGPSVSGKTTLLRIIDGLEFPEEGQVSFHGEDVNGLQVADRQVGLVFTTYTLFKHVTWAQNGQHTEAGR